MTSPYGTPLTDLSDDLKDRINQCCIQIFYHVKNKHQLIRSVIIQENQNQIYIGTTSNGIFEACYYDSTSKNNDQELLKIITNNRNVIDDCKAHIDQIYPQNKMRSFNIFYNKNGKINVCQNTIGNKGMNKSRLFNEFSL